MRDSGAEQLLQGGSKVFFDIYYFAFSFYFLLLEQSNIETDCAEMLDSLHPGWFSLHKWVKCWVIWADPMARPPLNRSLDQTLFQFTSSWDLSVVL